MILTGKAKEDFLKYASYNYGEDSSDLAMMRSVMRNALIIEFFDSVGIYISIRATNNEFMSYITNNEFSFYEKTRQEATEKAITKANDIYNETKA